jgi:hypothetical protein
VPARGLSRLYDRPPGGAFLRIPTNSAAPERTATRPDRPAVPVPRALGQWDSLYGYFFGRLGQGWLGLMIRVMSCIIIHDPGMSTPEFNSTTIVIPSAGRWYG